MSREAIERAADRAVQGIFGPLEAGEAPAAVLPGGTPRLQCPDRRQVVMSWGPLDERLAEDHQARLVWAYVESADLSLLYEKIKAVEGWAGRRAIDPKILLTLWLYATLDGVGSAREIDRLCTQHDAYRWICGGVSVNYHSISDFRTEHVGFLDQLLSDSVAALVHEGLVTLNRVAQDGVRVRASAGAASFRRRPTLEECQAEAQEQVRKLRDELDADPAAVSKRQQAARQRAVRERSERLGQALAQMQELEKKRQAAAKKESAKDEPDKGDQDKGEQNKSDRDKDGPNKDEGEGQGKKKEPSQPRVSTTDPEATVMKMGDGGFRPAYNIQYATDTATQIITGVDAGTIGSDQGQMGPMVEQHEDRYQQRPNEVLVDGGFAKKSDIEQVSSAGVTVYAPVQKPRKAEQDPYARRPGDSDAIAAWRERMASKQGKTIYKERASTAECVNATARNRGLYQFLVRGLEKIKAVALMFALAHNLVRAVTLRAQLAAAAG
jgi:transposase